MASPPPGPGMTPAALAAMYAALGPQAELLKMAVRLPARVFLRGPLAPFAMRISMDIRWNSLTELEVRGSSSGTAKCSIRARILG
jgi:hypothetical protein